MRNKALFDKSLVRNLKSFLKHGQKLFLHWMKKKRANQ